MALPHRLLLILAVVLMAMVLTAGPALAAPGGNGQGYGGGIGGGKHFNPGNHYGQIKHDDCQIGCTPA